MPDGEIHFRGEFNNIPSIDVVAWLSGLYLAARLGTEKMAEEVGYAAFCIEIGIKES